jgi:hypothetical protein
MQFSSFEIPISFSGSNVLRPIFIFCVHILIFSDFVCSASIFLRFALYNSFSVLLGPVHPVFQVL